MAKIKSDAHLYLTETGDAAPAAVDVEGITNTEAAVVTLGAALPAAAANGDLAMFAGTGEPLLDGYAFRISGLDVTTPALADLRAARLRRDAPDGGGHDRHRADFPEGGRPRGSGGLHGLHYGRGRAARLDPDGRYVRQRYRARLAEKPPTFTYTGFVDKDSLGFKNLMQASLESPKTERWMLVDYTVGGGYIFGPVEIGEVTVTAQTAQELQFSGTGVFKEMPTYSWAL